MQSHGNKRSELSLHAREGSSNRSMVMQFFLLVQLFLEFMYVAAYLDLHDQLLLKQTLTNESIYPWHK